MTEIKTVLVTGASRGIGQGIALALSRPDTRLVCVSTSRGGCDETVARCLDSGASAATAIVCDVADGDAVAAMAREVEGEAGRVDVLVNNAGVTRDGLFLRMSDDDFDTVLGVNLRGSFLTARAFARGMTKARWGRIVNIGSVVGSLGNAGQANYAASKAGMIGLTKSLAKELGSRGVTVNLVAPGWITTDMTSGLAENIQEAALKNIPLGRFGSPEDIAAAVQFLCSDAASYITGQVLMVDGGMAM